MSIHLEAPPARRPRVCEHCEVSWVGAPGCWNCGRPGQIGGISHTGAYLIVSDQPLEIMS